jgi:hypothetical protein
MRHILLDIANGQPSRSGDFAFTCLHHPRHAAQQRGFSASIGCDKPDAVTGINDKVQLRKQRRVYRHAEIADVDEGHDHALVLPAIVTSGGMQPPLDVVSNRGD